MNSNKPLRIQCKSLLEIVDRKIQIEKELQTEIDKLKAQITALSRGLAEACAIGEECEEEIPPTWIKTIADANNGAGWREILEETKE